MSEIERIKLLEKYEKLVVGHSSELFDNEEWAEFDAFLEGYKLAFKLFLPILDLGMTLRQNQLAGYDGRSGKEALEEFLKDK